MERERLVLGIDGGGTRTTACLAVVEPGGTLRIVGRGTSGGSNPFSVGILRARRNLFEAIELACREAGQPTDRFAVAVFALAGVGDAVARQRVSSWVARRRLAQRVRVVTDVEAVLAAASDASVGVAVISGTGSLAFGRSADGRTARAGGWGWLLGDEGSGYAIGVAALRAAVRAADGRGRRTALLPLLLEELSAAEPRELVTRLPLEPETRVRVAELAPLVLQAAASGDREAERILRKAARELAQCVAAVVRSLKWSDGTFPLALAGSLLSKDEHFRRLLLEELRKKQPSPRPVVVVREPAEGAVRLAWRELTRAE